MPLLLGSATQTSPGVSLFAPASGGGGGGGGGPDPSFSSINMAAQGTIFCSENGGLAYVYSTGNPANTQYFTDDTGSNYVLEWAIPSYSMAPNNVSSMTGVKVSLINQNGVFDGLQCGGIIFDGNGQGSSALTPAMASDVNANLNVWASNVSISSMTISSINGAAPGGGGSIPQDLVVSSLTSLSASISSIHSERLFNSAGYLALKSGGSGTTTWGGNNNTFISQNNTKLIVVDGNNNGEVQFNNMTAVKILQSDLQVSSINGAAPGGSGFSVNASTFSTLVSLSTINYGSPGVLTIFGSASVTDTIGCSGLSTIRIDSIVPGGNVVVPLLQSSNLAVSSINGSAYPPAGGGAVFSTLYDTSSTIVCNPGGPTQLLGFPCVNGQGYNVSWQVGVTGFAATTINAGENILGLLTVDGGTTSIAGNVTLAAVSTNAALGFDSLQVGGCLNFKGGTNSNVFLEVYNNTNSTVTVTLNESYLVTY